MDIKEIEEILRRHYEIEDDDQYSMECGCYVNGEWLSVQEILDVLEEGY